MVLQPDIEIGEPDRDVTERMRRFLRSRDPRVLWPALTASALTAAGDAIERVVRAVLAGETPATLDASADGEAYALKIAAFTTGTGALLGRWIEDGRVQSGPLAQERFARELDQGRARAARLEQGMLPVFDALLARGISPVLLKGFHTAHAYCEEPGVRPVADVDILVSPTRIDDAEVALVAAGFRPSGPRRVRPYKRHWMAAGIDSRVFSVEGIDARARWEIDLHVSFDRQFPTGVASLDADPAHVVPIDIAGRWLGAPAQPLLLLVLACQISCDLKSMRLMRLIDLVRVIRTDRARGRLDWDQVLETFRRTGAGKFAYPALALAEALAPGTIEPNVLEHARTESTWGIRHAVKHLVPAGRGTGHTSVLMWLMWANDPLDVIKILWRVLAGIVSGGPREIFVVCRVLLRRIAAGAFSFGPPDEGQRETTPPRHQERGPPPATRDARGAHR